MTTSTNSPKKALMWSQENCQYCTMAKSILEVHGYEVEVRKLSKDEGGWSKESLLRAVPNARSVPQVFINGTYVGGYKEVSEYLTA